MALYFHETLHVPPDRQQAFCECWQKDFLPAMKALGIRPLGIWKQSSVKGDPGEIVAMWELRDWQHARQLAAGLAGGGAGLGAWRERSEKFVTRHFGKIMRQRASQRILDNLGKAGMSTRFCFHETMYIEPGRELDYVRAMEIQLGPSCQHKGWRMVGEFQPVFQSGQIVNLWAMEKGFESMAGLGKPDPDEFFHGGYWMEIGLALRQHWRSVWMLPLPIEL